jgi:hypothetical protein
VGDSFFACIGQSNDLVFLMEFLEFIQQSVGESEYYHLKMLLFDTIGNEMFCKLTMNR